MSDDKKLYYAAMRVTTAADDYPGDENPKYWFDLGRQIEYLSIVLNECEQGKNNVERAKQALSKDEVKE